jgi:hypothetical protein
MKHYKTIKQFISGFVSYPDKGQWLPSLEGASVSSGRIAMR